MTEQLQAMYLDYVNNYITVGRFAECNGLTFDEALTVIRLGRQIHERLVAPIGGWH